MKIAVTAETTVDLTPELLQKYDIKTIACTVILGEEEHLDGVISTQEIFEYAEKNKALPKTSAVNSYQYKEFFDEILKEYDGIIHISISSKISSMCNNAMTAAQEYNNVMVVDSKSLSTGIALLAMKAREMAQQNMTLPDIYQKVSDLVSKVQASFVVKKLDYLRKGGRCSALAYLGANLLSIRPQIMVKDGSLGVHKKYVGKMEKVISTYCSDVLKEFPNPDKSVAFVTYTTASEEMVANAKQALSDKGFANIYETKAGATIASHCGENTLGILFLNE